MPISQAKREADRRWVLKNSDKVNASKLAYYYKNKEVLALSKRSDTNAKRQRRLKASTSTPSARKPKPNYSLGMRPLESPQVSSSTSGTSASAPEPNRSTA